MTPGKILHVVVFDEAPTWPPRLSIHPKTLRTRFLSKRSAIKSVEVSLMKHYGCSRRVS